MADSPDAKGRYVNTTDPTRAWRLVRDSAPPCGCGAECTIFCNECYAFLGCETCSKDEEFHSAVCGYSLSYDNPRDGMRMITSPISDSECHEFMHRAGDEKQITAVPEFIFKVLSPDDQLRIAVKGIRHMHTNLPAHRCYDNAMKVCRLVRGMSPVWGWRVRETIGAYECSGHVLVADVDGTLYDLETDLEMKIADFVFVYSRTLRDHVAKTTIFPDTIIIRKERRPSDLPTRAVIDLDRPLAIAGAMQYLSRVPRRQVVTTFEAITAGCIDQTTTGPRMIMAVACERHAHQENISITASALQKVSELATLVRNVEVGEFSVGRFPVLRTYLALMMHTAPGEAIASEEAQFIEHVVNEVDACAPLMDDDPVENARWQLEFLKVTNGTFGATGAAQQSGGRE